MSYSFKIQKQPPKKRLCFIFGGPPQQLVQRIDIAMKSCSLDTHDILFSGLKSEYKLFKSHMRKKYGKIWRKLEGKVAYAYAHNTWDNICNTKPYWHQYSHIVCVSGYFHLKRISHFFKLQGRDEGLSFRDSREEESPWAEVLYLIEDTPTKIKFLSKFSYFIRVKLMRIK